MKYLSLLLLLLLATTISIYGQVESEEVYYEEPEQDGELKDWSSGWHVGLESLKILQSALWNLTSEGHRNINKMYSFEAISYYQGRSIWRPTFRAGYSWFRDYKDFDASGRSQRMIMSRGAYVKIGTDILTRQKEKENHALGVYGVLSYGNEYYNFRVGNDFFGYKEVFYKQDTWATGIELKYTFTQAISPKINYQLGGYVVSLLDWGSEELMGYKNLPGISGILGMSLHFLYKVR